VCIIVCEWLEVSFSSYFILCGVQWMKELCLPYCSTELWSVSQSDNRTQQQCFDSRVRTSIKRRNQCCQHFKRYTSIRLNIRGKVVFLITQLTNSNQYTEFTVFMKTAHFDSRYFSWCVTDFHQETYINSLTYNYVNCDHQVNCLQFYLQ